MSKGPFLRTPYNYDADAVSLATGLLCEDKSLTQQSAKDECDINVILDRWVRTGDLSTSSSVPQYGDFTGFTDYHSALNTVIEAQDAFDALPAKLRARFGNDPQQLLDFVQDRDNLEEAVSLGLATVSEDLSRGVFDRASKAQANIPVGKSTKVASTAQRASNSPEEGGEGEA